jgi:arginyl-tRNA synthetase
VWQEIFSDVKNIAPRVKNGKRAIMEIFSLNVGKPLHIWHLCPTSTGQAIVNVHKYLWWDIIVDNHMWDWWSLFGKLIVWYQKYWNAEKLQNDWVEHLQELYVKITSDIEKDPNVDQECKDAFVKLSRWDKELMELWWIFTKTSLKKAYQVVEKLHVYNDIAIWEAFYEWLPLPKIGDYPELTYTMDMIVTELIEKNIATKNEDGSVGIIFPDESKLPSTILEKRDGTHGDLACIKYRVTNWWNPDKISIGTDVRQELHFKQVFTTARMAWWISENIELVHVGNWFISLPNGAMSSRKGNIIRLEDLIEEWFIRTKNILESKWRTLKENDIQEIAIGAMKYSYLMQDRERNIVFDWDKALNFEGNSGPYIQYAYVRASKILKEAGGDICHPELAKDPENQKHGFSPTRGVLTIVPQNDEKLKLSTYDKSLIQSLARMTWVIDETASKYKPHILALYCYELAVTFNSFYVHTPKVLEEQDITLKAFRMSLIAQTTHQLKLGFELLGIHMPSEM